MDQALSIRGAGATLGSNLIAAIMLEMEAREWDRGRELVDLALSGLKERSLPDQSRYHGMYRSLRGHIERKAGNLDAALRIYAQTIRFFHDLSFEPAVINLIECYAMIAVEKDELKRAGTLFGAAEAQRQRVQADMTPLERVEYSAMLAQFKTQADPEALAMTWERGRSMTLDQAVEFALRYQDLGSG